MGCICSVEPDPPRYVPRYVVPVQAPIVESPHHRALNRRQKQSEAAPRSAEKQKTPQTLASAETPSPKKQKKRVSFAPRSKNGDAVTSVLTISGRSTPKTQSLEVVDVLIENPYDVVWLKDAQPGVADTDSIESVGTAALESPQHRRLKSPPPQHARLPSPSFSAEDASVTSPSRTFSASSSLTSANSEGLLSHTTSLTAASLLFPEGEGESVEGSEYSTFEGSEEGSEDGDFDEEAEEGELEFNYDEQRSKDERSFGSEDEEEEPKGTATPAEKPSGILQQSTESLAELAAANNIPIIKRTQNDRNHKGSPSRDASNPPSLRGSSERTPRSNERTPRSTLNNLNHAPNIKIGKHSSDSNKASPKKGERGNVPHISQQNISNFQNIHINSNSNNNSNENSAKSTPSKKKHTKKGSKRSLGSPVVALSPIFTKNIRSAAVRSAESSPVRKLRSSKHEPKLVKPSTTPRTKRAELKSSKENEKWALPALPAQKKGTTGSKKKHKKKATANPS